MKQRAVSWRPFLIAFPLLATIPIGILSAYAVWSANSDISDIEQTERQAVELQLRSVARDLDQVAATVCFLSEQTRLEQFLLTGEPDALDALAREYRILAQNVPAYDQIRFIDAAGRERVRVNGIGGSAEIVPSERLQDKSGRYYVTETLSLLKGEVYVSPMDLNIENGEIERPFKPMIRLGTPVMGPNGQVSGALVINFRAQAMLDAVQEAGAVSIGDAMMLNSDGYWLVSPNPPPSWGFMFPEGAHDRMDEVYPAAWRAMRSSPQGSVRTVSGLFTFIAFRPLRNVGNCAASDGPVTGSFEARKTDYTWVLASHVPANVLHGIRLDAFVQAVMVGAPIVLLLALATRTLNIVLTERRRHRERLETLARTDGLTGLSNRVTFEERLEQEIHRSDRHARHFALLYLDLDGFKQINDTAGHAAGDKVLVDIARTLEQCCRRVDLVARCGGDEFVVLLSEAAGADAARTVARKMLDRISALSWDDQVVGASIGIAVWPDHAADGPRLMQAADAAMYEAKQAGKGTICVA